VATINTPVGTIFLRFVLGAETDPKLRHGADRYCPSVEHLDQVGHLDAVVDTNGLPVRLALAA
jgi:hypothetical protein